MSGRKVRQQLVLTRVTVSTELAEHPGFFRAECSCGWLGRKVKLAGTARRHMREHYATHKPAAVPSREEEKT